MSEEITAYSAHPILLIARDAARSCDKRASDSLVAIVFSALGVEAVANELLELVRTFGSFPSAPDQVRHLSVLSRAAHLQGRSASLTDKIQIISAGLRREVFQTDKQPFQDFDLLVELRNFLVHARPESVTRDDSGSWKHPKLVRSLVSRGLIPKPPLTQATFSIDLLEQPAVARWAYESALRMARALVECFPAKFADMADLARMYRWDWLALEGEAA